MKRTLDTGETVSENDCLVEIVKEVVCIRASSSKTTVPSKVILGYIPPSWFGAQTKKPTKNLEGV